MRMCDCDSPVLHLLIFCSMCCVVATDFYHDVRPTVRFLSPFIIPSTVQLLYSTPRVVYHIGVLRLRAADLMWYGGMIALVSFDVVSISMMFIGVLASLVLTVFVVPFALAGKMYRPLPSAFVCLVVTMICSGSLVSPYVLSATTVHATA